MTLEQILNSLSALAAFVAAVFWWLSATVKVEVSEAPGPDGWSSAVLSSDGADFVASAKEQLKWSKRGAYAAAVAALCQGLALTFPLIKVFWTA